MTTPKKSETTPHDMRNVGYEPLIFQGLPFIF